MAAAGLDDFPDDLVLQIRGVRVRETPEGPTLDLALDTTRGEIRALLDVCEGSTGAVVTCDGAVGGPHEVLGPGDRVYERLAATLRAKGVSSLRLHYREAGAFEESVMDVLAACSFLRGVGARRVVLVGHSFGGAVAIKAGQLSPVVVAVAALSSQLFGTRQVHELDKPLLLIHGALDQVLAVDASQDIFERAQEPKRLVILERSGHALREDAARLFDELEPFLLRYAGGAPA